MSLRESLYRLRRVAAQIPGHADVWAPDVRNALDALKASRAEVRQLRSVLVSIRNAYGLTMAADALAPAKRTKR